MQRTIRMNVTYGFLILALGMMLTDLCRLARTPNPAVSATNGQHQVHKFSY